MACAMERVIRFKYREKFINFLVCFLINLSHLRRTKNRRIWIKNLSAMFNNLDCHNKKDVLESLNFFRGIAFDKITLIKKRENGPIKKDLVLICVLRDERERIDYFLEYYRNLGVKHFAMIDNASKDGTLDYLKKQKDTDVYLVKDKFAVGRKEGWINRLLCLYGYYRWYLCVDADELLDWPEKESYTLNNITTILAKNKIHRAGALMVDMYSDTKMFQTRIEKFDVNKFYFDSDTYYLIQEGEKKIYTGGPRKRIFNMECWLSKYPLFYLNTEEMLISAHYLSPYYSFERYPYLFALLHFKFLTRKDLEKVMEYVKEENHASKSYEYKQYMYNYKNNINRFYSKTSIRYESEKSLLHIKCIEKVSEWD